jgi:5-methylcytosine-specific restriction endonuclease McrA
MPIVLSQRIDVKSEYEDVPFSLYHFPKRYIRQLKTGDRFVYYQGDRNRKDRRYYFGCGVVGAITPDTNGESHFAEIIDGCPFPNKVPIYNPIGGFYESIDYAEVRKSESPPWQQSVRLISDSAFSTIMQTGSVPHEVGVISQTIESGTGELQVLRELNEKYSLLEPETRNRRIAMHLDRGVSVTKSLKKLLGSECQICRWGGFLQSDGSNYIEAHHLVQISAGHAASLCTENVILVCPNCHRELHYGKNVEVRSDGNFNIVRLSGVTTRIQKNTIEYLESQHASSTLGDQCE